MKTYLLHIIFMTISLAAFGEKTPESNSDLRDSLQMELRAARADSSRVQALIQLAESFEYSNSDSTYYYAEKAFRLAKKDDNIPAQMGAMSFMAYALLRSGKLPQAMEIGLEAIRLGKDLPVQIAGGIGPVYSVLGELYIEIGDYEKAKMYFQQMTELGGDDIVGVAYGQFYLAMIFDKLNQPDSADFYLDESYRSFGTLNYSFYPDVYNVYPPWYNLRAKMYLKRNQPDLALKDLFTSLEMTVRNGDIFHVTNTCIDISNYYERYKQPDSAIYYAEMALKQATKINYTKGSLMADEILARLFESGDPAKALKYYKQAGKSRNNLYGAGNIQIMRDMIAKEEKRQAEIEATKTAYQNRMKMNAILGIAFTLFITAILLYVIIRRKQKAKQRIESAYDQLKTTQAQLIHAEKMASLGELTAGIAHEIQNPLNFVNNFSEVSIEIMNDLRDEMDKGDHEEVEAISNDLQQNLEKIKEHGKRASSIVKGMLQHSRAGSEEKVLTDINSLADEYLRLAYHGLRAKDKSFNADFRFEADENLPKMNVVPQDIGRVLLNLINNAFYAVSEKAKHAEDGYKPSVIVSTKYQDAKVEIRVSDNGGGIPDKVKDKIFQPFFTTKPSGQGTGLGLSMSYDIITKGHGGEITVTSKEGEGTEFIIQIPIKTQ